MHAKPHPRRDRDITCYHGNITVEERYGQLITCCLGNRSSIVQLSQFMLVLVLGRSMLSCTQVTRK